MRVLFITHVLSMAGANRCLFQLVKELKQDYKVEPMVLAPNTDNSNGTIISALQEIGVLVITADIRFFKLEHPSFRNVIGYIRYLWRQRFLYKELQSYHFDIIHSNSSVIDVGAYLSNKLGVKHVWHLREFGDRDYNLKPIGGRWYESFTYRHADAFIAISKVIAHYFRCKVPRDKIHISYDGIFAAADILPSTHDNAVREFFCAGIICEGKNQKEIVLALDELINMRQVKDTCRLTLVGIQTQPYTDQLMALIREKHLDEYVRVLPEMNGIQSLAASMDVGIMCSKAEAFGRVTIEYQLQNLLVIANKSGANTELIEDGKTGLLYESGNYKSLANKMQWAIEHPNDLKELALKGMENARRNFTSERNTCEIHRLYQELLSHS